MKITIYQIVPDLDHNHLMFRDLRFIKKASGNRIPAELYKSVYHGNLAVESPEDVFYIFNVAHPEGYTGRSVSVSDVVKFYAPSGGSRFYFCDTIGFQEIEFDEGKAALSTANHDEGIRR